jgi:hypothetical protein
MGACFSTDEQSKKEIIVPDKISILFVTQPHCPSCDKLEQTMKLNKPKALLDKYFVINKFYYGEKFPDGLTPPNGTPTVYFLGADNIVLVEPMVGEKTEESLMEFLEDALYEFKNTYHIDLIEKYKENNESNSTKFTATA